MRNDSTVTLVMKQEPMWSSELAEEVIIHQGSVNYSPQFRPFHFLDAKHKINIKSTFTVSYSIDFTFVM